MLHAVCVLGQTPEGADTPHLVLRQALLTERGVKCDGCAEKKDLVARVEETYDMPVVTATQVRLALSATDSGSRNDFAALRRRARRPPATRR